MMLAPNNKKACIDPNQNPPHKSSHAKTNGGKSATATITHTSAEAAHLMRERIAATPDTKATTNK